MKISKSQRSNIIFLIVIALLIIPQTRQPIQVFLNKGLTLFNPSTVKENEQISLSDYDWKLKNINGDFLNFKDVKGKVVFVNFWATWCPPCIAEMSDIQRLYDDYKDKIEFVFVSNESFEIINTFLNKNGYSMDVYNSLTAYPETFNVTSIPRTFLIDKKGNIVIDKTGAANWNGEKVRETIDGLLKL